MPACAGVTRQAIGDELGIARFVLSLALVAVLLVPASAESAPGASLVDIEDEVMCVTCKIPLNLADNPQATRQRELIRRLIARGLDKQQIKTELVAEYGDDVLALPRPDGVGVTAYVVPIALVVMLAAALVLLMPRRRSRSAARPSDDAVAALSSADARRLDDELARYR